MKRYTKKGFALVELLIAAAIAGLLLAVVLAVYGSILNTVTAQTRWREKTTPAAEALDLIIRDLACAAIPLGATNPPFTFAFGENSEENFQLSFYSAFSTETSNDWRSYSISRVTYSFQAAGGTEEFVLARECDPFRVPARNPLAAGREKWRGIRKLKITFFDGATWSNRWTGAQGTNALPQAARISIGAGQDNPPELRTEVFINAGRQILAEKSK